MKLYDTVRQANLPQQRLLEATRGAILARGAAGLSLLIEQLQSADKAQARHWLTHRSRASRPRSDRGPGGRIGPDEPERQPLLLLAMADRSDAAVLPVVVKAAQSGPKGPADCGP